MVTNGKLVLDHEIAPRRVRSGMRGLRESDPDDVLHYLTQECGLLRELPDQSLQFLHRTFRDYLAAKEVFDEDNINQMLEHANRPDWHDVVVMAGAHARPRERAEILTRLINRSDTEPANRESLVLLAHAILEQATVLPTDRLDVRTLVDNAVQGLIPPQSTNAADRLADVGPLVLDLLPDTGRCTDDEQVLLPHALASREFAPPEPMKVTSNVTGPLIWLDENGEPGGTFDVFDYLAICREHYDKVRIGSAVIDGLIR